MHKILTLTAAAIILAACSKAEVQDKVESTTKDVVAAAKSDEAGSAKKYKASAKKVDPAKLAKILTMQPEENQARYDARHPQETLEFFGIAPGMKVGEALPGGGWYTKILVPYLGPKGKLVGIDYSFDMWPEFSFATEEFIEGKKTWPTEFVTKAAEWAPADGAKMAGTTFGLAPGKMEGKLDSVLFIRALHNLARFEAEGQYMSSALTATHALLKPGGTVGVVQHRAPADADADWAKGSAGYLKQADVIAAFDAAGFDLVKSSEINANPKDKPEGDDVVWRLPPSLRGSGDDAELKAKRKAIGESDRMTLLFKKR